MVPMSDEAPSTSLARSLRPRDLAQEIARRELVVVRAERTAPRLVEAVRLGKAVGLSVSEMERMAGCSRQTIYTALRQLSDDEASARRGVMDSATLMRQVLVAVVASEGDVPVAELARRLRVGENEILTAGRALDAQRLCSLSQYGSDASARHTIGSTPRAEQALSAHFDDLYLSRVEGFSVYLAVDPAEADAIAASAAALVSRDEHVLMDARVAPSVMRGPELALVVYAPTSRMAISIARDLWDELRAHANLPPAALRVQDVAPPFPQPCGDSAVLDGFVAAITEQAPDLTGDIVRQRMRYPGGVDERTLTGRCLTAAARVLRSTAGQPTEPRPIANADAAWGELTPAVGLRLDAKRSKVQRATVEALELAAERLGPFRGGEMGAFRAPGKPPRIVEEIHPSAAELERMAASAGTAVGFAAGLGLDPAVEVAVVVSGAKT
jgi:hypothetical protein